MNKLLLLPTLFLALWSLPQCNRPRQAAQTKSVHRVKQAELPVRYAKGFTVDYYDGFKIVSLISQTDSANILAQYALIPKGKKAPLDFPDALVIDTPATKVVCVATNQIAEMQRLGLTAFIAGVTGAQLIYDPKLRDLVAQGSIANLGQTELNSEKLLALAPSFVFSSGTYDGGDKLKNKLAAFHIPLVLNFDYLEQDPLARAEWIKFVAAFFNREEEASRIFDSIEHNYLELKKKAQEAKYHPSVFCNIPFKEIWYMPSGANYTAKLIEDAGGDFLWKNSSPTNGLSLSLDEEAVYAKAAHADFWINTGTAASLEELKAIDRRNTFFDAYKHKKIYNNDRRNTPQGGFDFWESGVVCPDKILADLLFIFHPELLPDHKLFYYRQLH